MGFGLYRKRRVGVGAGNDHAHLALYQIGSQVRQAIVSTFRPSVLDQYVLALNISSFSQSLVKLCHATRVRHGRTCIEKPNHRHRGLLRTRRKRPRCRCATEQRYELAPSHAGHWLASQW